MIVLTAMLQLFATADAPLSSREERPAQLAVGPMAGVAMDGGLWLGASARMGAPIEPLFVFLQLQFLEGSAGRRQPGERADDISTGGYEAEAAFGAGWPIELGRTRWMPALAVGFGYLAAEENRSGATDLLGARAEASFAISIAVAEGLSLEARAGIDLLPLIDWSVGRGDLTGPYPVVKWDGGRFLARFTLAVSYDL